MFPKLRLLGFLTFILVVSTNLLKAQVANVPDGILFQAIATDPLGNAAGGRTIYIKNSILQGSPTGTNVYSETFKVTSSSTGVFTIVIGKGQYVSGVTSIQNLDWTAGPYFLTIKVAVAPSITIPNWDPNQQYVDMGTSQFWTVPFAMYASKVAGLDLKVNLADTANMLKPYLRKTDTLTLSNRINTKVNTTDTATMLAPYLKAALLNGKVNYSDTAAMLTNYAKAAAIPNVSGKVNYTDTATMLAPYLKAALLNGKVNYTDTAAMLTNYAKAADVTNGLTAKVNTADTATMLSPYAKTTTTNAALALKLNIADTAAMLANNNNAITNIKATYLPLTGGTLTGVLTLPNATFTALTNGTAGTDSLLVTRSGVTKKIAANTYLSSGSYVPYTGATSAVNLGAYDLAVNGLTVGLGAGNVTFNTTVGNNALSSNTNGNFNSAIGFGSLNKNTTGNSNTAFGSL
jgi:hypothetical protein